MEHQAVYEAETILSQAAEPKTLTFRDPTLRHGFAQVSNLVLRDASLSSNAKVLYALLLSYAWQKEQCFPGQETLVQDTGNARSTVCAGLAELKDRKLISWERRGLGKTSLYTIERLDGGYLPKQYVDRGANG